MTTTASGAAPRAALPNGAADLHSHTTASDGLLSPQALVAEAKTAGLAALGLTDHDTVDAIAAAVEAAGDDIHLVPGIELSATAGRSQAHILGYFIDPASPQLRDALTEFRRQREERMRRFATRLTSLGMPIAPEEVAAEAGSGSMGRPHLARVMIRHGYVADVAEAFDRWIGFGRPAFVERDDITPEACIALIHAAGGVAVLAHPYSTGDPDGFAERLKPAGLSGLEVEYGAYDEPHRAYLRTVATRHGLVPTGGSDYHGPEHRENLRLGDGLVPVSTVAELARLAGR